MCPSRRFVSLLSIVIPVRNEAASVPRLFEALNAHVRVPSEFVVVYDSDEDPTIAAARDAASRLPGPLRLVRNEYGPGPGRALRAGFDAAAGDAILVVMADLSDDLRLVDDMYRRIEGGADVVCGSRYMRGGVQRGGPLLKRLMSRAAGVSLWYAGVPTHDVTNAFKMYRTSTLRSLDIEGGQGFEISMEITIKAWLARARVVEIPATWVDRTEGESKFRLWKWLPRYLRWYAYALLNTEPND